jgi:hypothetical protein
MAKPSRDLDHVLKTHRQVKPIQNVLGLRRDSVWMALKPASPSDNTVTWEPSVQPA